VLQVFYVDVAKVDRDVAYVCCNGYTRILHVSVPNVSVVSDGCYTCSIWVLHMFDTYVASVSFGCCICFHTYVVSVFYLDIAYVLQWLHACFPRVSDVSVSTVSYVYVCCRCFL
jgi:hypothetical protein